MNKLGRGPLADATYQISRFRPCGFRHEGFFFCVFPIEAYVKHMTPGKGPFLALQGL